ncbi:MAG: hypothetical protein WC523_04075 [Patescibacteria group bacterium]
MQKSIDIKNRIVDYYDADTGQVEDEVVAYLDKKMKVRFHSASFNNSKYVFMGNPKDKAPNSITISSYRDKKPGEKVSIDISTNY